MKRGDLFWAVPDPGVGREQAGRRPVLVISSDDAITALPQVVTTIPLTSRQRGWPTHVEVTGPRTGLSQPTWALCEQVRTILTQRLHGQLGTADMSTLDKAAASCAICSRSESEASGRIDEAIFSPEES